MTNGGFGGFDINSMVQGLASLFTLPLNVIFAVPQKLTQAMLSGGQDMANGAQNAANGGDPSQLLQNAAQSVQKIFQAPFAAVQEGQAYHNNNQNRAAEALTSGTEYVGEGPPSTVIY